MHAVADTLKPVSIIEREERGEEHGQCAAGRANCEQMSVAQQKVRSAPMSDRSEGAFTLASRSRTGVIVHPCTMMALLR